jgi:hypothetical protein
VRNGLSVDKGVLLWLDSVLNAERQTRLYPRVFVAYEDLLGSAEKVVGIISQRLQLDLEGALQDAREDIGTFLDPALNHQRADAAAVALPPIVAEVFELCRRASGMPLSEFDRVGAELLAYRRLLYVPEIRQQEQRYGEIAAELRSARSALEAEQAQSVQLTRALAAAQEAVSRLQAQREERERVVGDLRLKLGAQREERERVVGELRSAKEDAQRLRAANRRLGLEISRVKRKEVLSAEGHAKRAQQLLERLHAAEDELAAVYTSHTWTCSRPLRGLMRRLSSR